MSFAPLKVTYLRMGLRILASAEYILSALPKFGMVLILDKWAKSLFNRHSSRAETSNISFSYKLILLLIQQQLANQF